MFRSTIFLELFNFFGLLYIYLSSPYSCTKGSTGSKLMSTFYYLFELKSIAALFSLGAYF